MKWLLRTLGRKDARDAILVLVAVAGAVATGLWTVFVYFAPPPASRVEAPAKPGPDEPAPKPSPPPPPREIERTVSTEGGIAIGGNVENSQVTVSSVPADGTRR
jgi:hypothetical protein